jgi:DtxR family Mn-dependent transcriptional regulator
MYSLNVIGESTEMYLKTIHELSYESSLVPISELAERLGISPVSATEMVHRMQDQGLLEHERYQGVHLTQDGADQAISVLRRHRLWELFLHQQLDIAWAEVHDYACQLEHSVGVEVTEALATYLNHPTTCPPGNPIPDRHGEVVLRRGVQLDTLGPSETGVVMRVRPESYRILSRLAEIGAQPGQMIEILSVDEHDDLWTIRTPKGTFVIGKSIAARVEVEA